MIDDGTEKSKQNREILAGAVGSMLSPGLLALVSLGDGSISNLGASNLGELVKVYKSRCFVKVWCAVHGGELVAAIFKTSAGPLVVEGDHNDPAPHSRRSGREAWVPGKAALLMSGEQMPAVVCNRCNATRPSPDFAALWAKTDAGHRRVSVSV